MSKLPTPRWPFGTVVYLKVSSESVGMVTGYIVRPGNVLVYLVSWHDKEDDRWEEELTDERTFTSTEA